MRTRIGNGGKMKKHKRSDDETGGDTGLRCEAWAGQQARRE